jgi:hypothetical protein
MKTAIILSLFLILPALASEKEPAWSDAVDGLRARLVVLPSSKDAQPFERVFIEFDNALGGEKNIRFNPDQLKLRITDANGKELPTAAGVAYDGASPLWKPIRLPYAGTIRFQVSFPGAGYNPKDKAMIDVGPQHVWVLPEDGKTYFLSGSVSIKGQTSDDRNTDWSGVLNLPKARIPKQ